MTSSHQVEGHHGLEGRLNTCSDTLVDLGEHLKVVELDLVVRGGGGESPGPEDLQPGEGGDKRTEEQAKYNQLEELPSPSLEGQFIVLYCNIIFIR